MAQKVRSEVEQGYKEIQVLYYRIYSTFRNGVYFDSKIAEMNRVIDVEKNKYDYTINIVGSRAQYIDFNVRNSFFSGVTISIIKYATKFNHYSKRNKVINRRLPSNECLKYLEKKSQGYIIQYKVISTEKRKFIKELYHKLMKVKNKNKTKREILAILHNIVQYL